MGLVNTHVYYFTWTARFRSEDVSETVEAEN